MSPSKPTEPPEVTEGGSQSEGGYVVLARRYRPSQFSEVIGQQAVTRTLQNAISENRVHHAYLFTGSRGIGKTTVARIMAKALNCEEGTSANPCDTCDSCVDIREGRSVDVYEIDGASHTGVDDVRELRESVRYMPARSRYKIYIIDEVHMLSTSAFNALLKTLEEPPPHVVFMFATTEPHKIPATILSRCQRFGLKRVGPHDLVSHMASICQREELEVEPEGLALLARASEGSVRDSLSLLDQVFAYASGSEAISSALVSEVLGVADRRVLFNLSAALLSRDARAALQEVARLFDGGIDLSQFAQAFLGHLRDLTVARTCQDPAELVDATEAEFKDVLAQAKGEGGELLPQHFDRFARAAEEIARSAYPRLILEMAMIEMVHAEPVLPLGDLLDRLQQLEARLGPGGAPPPATPGPSGRGGRPSSRDSSPSAGPRGRGRPSSREPRAERPAVITDGAAVAAVAAAPEVSAPVAAPVANPIALPEPGQEMESWRALLERAKEEEPVAAGPFFSGTLLTFEGRTIRLGFPAGSFALQQARDAEKLGPFQAECARQTAGPIRVDIKELESEEQPAPPPEQGAGATGRSAREDKEIQRKERQRRLRAEARDNDLTQRVISAFDAEIVKITTDADKK